MITSPLFDVSLRHRARWHQSAALLIAMWTLASLALLLLRGVGVPVTWWVSIHSFTLGVLSSAILVYSAHFTQALTRTETTAYWPLAARLGLLQLGIVLLILGGAGVHWTVVADLGASVVAATIIWHAIALWRVLRRSLAGTFVVTVVFYLIACGCLVLAVLLAILASRGVGDYSGLIAAHARLMVWGWMLMVVLGTMVTLVPTVAGASIAPAARQRMSRALAVHTLALCVTAVALIIGYEQIAGFALLLVGLAMILLLHPLLSAALGGSRLVGAAAGMVAGLLWLVGAVVADALSLLGGMDARMSTLILIPITLACGCAQLILSVLSHLLPIMVGGGPDTVQRAWHMARTGWPARLVLLNAGGLGLLYGKELSAPGVVLIVLGLLWHLSTLVFAIISQRRAIPAPTES